MPHSPPGLAPSGSGGGRSGRTRGPPGRKGRERGGPGGFRHAAPVEPNGPHGQPRRGRQEDTTAVATTWLRSRRASYPAIPLPVHDDEDVHRWFAQVVLPQRETWVIDGAGGAVAALLVLE